MSGFTKTCEFTIEFDGDTVKVTAERFKKKDHFKIMKFGKFVSKEGIIEDEFEVDKNKITEYNKVAMEVLQEKVITMTGLMTGDTPPVELQLKDIIEETYFTTLVSEMFSNLSSLSFVKGEDEKK